MPLPSISVIVTTYNWPQALSRVLAGLCAQRYKHMEVIVADDGSNDATAEVVKNYRAKSRFPITHCWQPDEGFRAAMCRNKAVAKAKHDYLIFIDGDCVPLPHFVTNHAKLARKGWYVAGSRVLLNQSFTQQVLNESIPIEHWSSIQWIQAALMRKCNRFSPLKGLNLGILRNFQPKKWQGAKTCNLGLWRDDFIAVNGFDEDFVGWGFEDSDLLIRLQRHGVRRKYGKYAVEVCHLWHPSQDRKNVQENQLRLRQTLSSSQVKISKGIEQYLEHGNCQHS